MVLIILTFIWTIFEPCVQMPSRLLDQFKTYSSRCHLFSADSLVEEHWPGGVLVCG